MTRNYLFSKGSHRARPTFARTTPAYSPILTHPSLRTCGRIPRELGAFSDYERGAKPECHFALSLPLNAMTPQLKAKRQKVRTRRTPFTYVPPQSRVARLCFFTSVGMTEAAAGAGAQHIFRLNSAYDVDSAVGSTSTAGFTEWATFFSNYRVWSARVRVELTASGGSAGTGAVACIYPNATNTYLTNVNAWSVAPHSIKRTIRADTTGAGRNFCTLQKSYSLPAIARVTKDQYAIDMDYSGTTSSNPNRIIGLSVAAFGINAGAVVTFTFSIWVEMNVEFFNPVQLAV